MNRREVLRKMCGLSGASMLPFTAAAAGVPPKLCPVCRKECLASDVITAETTKAWYLDRTHIPVRIIYFHSNEKRCSIKLRTIQDMEDTPTGRISRTVERDGKGAPWRETHFSSKEMTWAEDPKRVSTTYLIEGGTE